MKNCKNFEFFNEHIRHLLLDDTKFREQTAKLDNLKSAVDTICGRLDVIQSNNCTRPYEDLVASFNNMSAKMAELEMQVNSLSYSDSTCKMSAQQLKSLQNINDIENNLAKVLEKVDRPEEGNNGKPPNHEVATQIEELSQKIEQFATDKSHMFISKEQSQSLSKLANFPLEKINDIEDGLHKLTDSVSQLQGNISMPKSEPMPDVNAPHTFQLQWHQTLFHHT